MSQNYTNETFVGLSNIFYDFFKKIVNLEPYNSYYCRLLKCVLNSIQCQFILFLEKFFQPLEDLNNGKVLSEQLHLQNSTTV